MTLLLRGDESRLLTQAEEPHVDLHTVLQGRRHQTDIGAGSHSPPAPGQGPHQEKSESIFLLLEEMEIWGAGTVAMKSTSAPEAEVLSPLSAVTAKSEKPTSDVRNLRMCESS